MPKQLTEQQKQQSADRKARFRQLVKQLSEMTDAQRAELAARMVGCATLGSSLSHHNRCLVASQNPAATMVGGFRQWIKQGRAVRKGEHGLMIWVPIVRKVDSGSAAAAGVNPDSQPTECGFTVGTVFDISQTDELPAADEPAAWSDVANGVDDGDAIKAPRVTGKRIDAPAVGMATAAYLAATDRATELRDNVKESFAWARPAA